MQFFDSHAHYNDEQFDQDREEIIKATFAAGVTKMICAGYSLKSSKQALEIANQYENIYAIVGISPNDIPEKGKQFEIELDQQLLQIEQLAKDPKVKAIGEIGLDYHWNEDNKPEQKMAFTKQIELANKLKLPIVIHTREAVYDTLAILKGGTPIKKGIFHCCPLNVDLVREGLKLGFTISFAGPVTFKNSKNAETIIQMVPLNKMTIETDSPYLAPEPKRGTRNDSRNVKYIAQKIATVKGISAEEVAKATYMNATKIFEI
ncbi:MAG: TatD family hydrolase [Clostridia bacterium]|nr:TatD family hydrolase [Clostridia bacterium]